MARSIMCPKCQSAVTFPTDADSVDCSNCGVTLKRKTRVASAEVEPQQTVSKKKKKKKKKIATGLRGPTLLILLGGVSIFLLGIGYLIYSILPDAAPAKQAGSDQSVVVAAPILQGPPPVPWKATIDPPASIDFPASGFIDLEKSGQEIKKSHFRGRHIVHLTGETGGLSMTPRIRDIHSGKVVGDLPAIFGTFPVSADGKRVAAVLAVPPPLGSPKNTPNSAEISIVEIEGLKTLRKLPLYTGMMWHDFGKNPDLLYMGISGPNGWTVMVADLKPEIPVVRSVPLSRRQGRTGGHVAVSPNRTYMAYCCERHVELFDMTTNTPAGIVEVSGQVGRCVFSADGKELLVISTFSSDGRPVAVSETTPFQWTTFSMTDGRELRKIEGTANLNFDEGKLSAGPDAESVIQNLNLYDIRFGAQYGTINKRLIGWLDAERIIIHDPDAYQLKVIRFDQAKLKTGHAELRRLLGERPPTGTPDTKELQQVSTDKPVWSVPVEAAPKRPADAYTSSPTTPNGSSEYLFPRADAVAWSAIGLTKETLPRLRYSMNWKKINANGDQGKPIELWPNALEPGDVPTQFGLGWLKVDQTAACDKLALRDPKNLGRVDIWDDTGKRITGFPVAESGGDVTWLAWAKGARLLTLADGKLTGWDGPKAKAVFRTSVTYTSVFLAPTRKWIACVADKQIDFIDTDTGKPLGRVVPPGSVGDWPALGISQDGQRFFGARSKSSANAQTGALAMLEFVTWDLRTGEQGAASTAYGVCKMRPGTLIHELNPKQWLIGNDILDHDCNITTLTLTLPTDADTFPMAYFGDRLWFPVARGSNPAGGRSATMLTSKLIPGDLVNPPKIKPADIVFRPGNQVKVTANMGNNDRNSVVKGKYEAALLSEGFVMGDGGWTIKVSGSSSATGDKITFAFGSEVSVPAVIATARLVAPDGTSRGLTSFGGTFGRTRSKYYVNTAAGGTSTQYDFGGRDPKAAMLEEAWEDAMTGFSSKFPLFLAKVDGKLVELPVPVGVK